MRGVWYCAVARSKKIARSRLRRRGRLRARGGGEKEIARPRWLRCCGVLGVAWYCGVAWYYVLRGCGVACCVVCGIARCVVVRSKKITRSRLRRRGGRKKLRARGGGRKKYAVERCGEITRRARCCAVCGIAVLRARRKKLRGRGGVGDYAVARGVAWLRGVTVWLGCLVCGIARCVVVRGSARC